MASRTGPSAPMAVPRPRGSDGSRLPLRGSGGGAASLGLHGASSASSAHPALRSYRFPGHHMSIGNASNYAGMGFSVTSAATNISQLLSDSPLSVPVLPASLDSCTSPPLHEGAPTVTTAAYAAGTAVAAPEEAGSVASTQTVATSEASSQEHGSLLLHTSTSSAGSGCSNSSCSSCARHAAEASAGGVDGDGAVGVAGAGSWRFRSCSEGAALGGHRREGAGGGLLFAPEGALPAEVIPVSPLFAGIGSGVVKKQGPSLWDTATSDSETRRKHRRSGGSKPKSYGTGSIHLTPGSKSSLSSSESSVSLDPATAAARERSRKRKLFASLVLLVISGAGVQIYMRRTLDALPNYSYFVFQSGAMAYFPLVLMVTLFKAAFTSQVTWDMTAPRMLPKFALMAFLDSLEDLAVVGVLPITMVFAFFLLRKRFSFKQMSAAACIVAGVVIVVMPSFSKHTNAANVGFSLLLFAGNIPGALSSLYKQQSLQHTKVDVFLLTTWITAFQVIIGFMLAPLNSLLPTTEGGMPLAEIGTQFKRGVKCLLGINSVVCNLPGGCAFLTAGTGGVSGPDGHGGSNAGVATNGTVPWLNAVCYQFTTRLPDGGNPHSGIPPCDDCANAWWKWALFILFVFAYNVVLLKVVKYGNAAFMYAANAVTLPLVNVLGTSSFIMGVNHAQPLNMYTVGGLVAMLAGLALWSNALWSNDKPKSGFLGPARFAMGVSYMASPQGNTGPGPDLSHLARDSMALRRGLYSRLGVSSPGPGRSLSSVARTPLLGQSPLPTWAAAAGAAPPNAYQGTRHSVDA